MRNEFVRQPVKRAPDARVLVNVDGEVFLPAHTGGAIESGLAFIEDSAAAGSEEYRSASDFRVFIRRHSPGENECGRVRNIEAIAVEYRGDIDRKQVVLVDHVVDLGTELARDLEQATFELLIDLHLGSSSGHGKWLLGVLDTPARACCGRRLWEVSGGSGNELFESHDGSSMQCCGEAAQRCRPASPEEVCVCASWWSEGCGTRSR